MKLNLLLSSFLLIFSFASAQINMADSSVQTVGYWDKNEKQSYVISIDKYKIKSSDTTSREISRYEVDITILDSTEKSYTIEWFYKNYSVDTDNELVRKLMSIAQDMKVIIKTDENGVFSEVVNWEEIRDYVKKALDHLRGEFKNVEQMESLIANLEATFSTREAIESASIADIIQYYTFHGAKYELDERLEGSIKVPNIFGGEAFDSDFTIILEEIDEKENNYILRATQEVNKKQLTDATFDYIVELSNKMGTKPPERNEIDEMKNETLTASQIHDSGWVLYSIQSKTIISDNISNVEERVIEIK